MFLTVMNRSTWRKPMKVQGEHANSTRNGTAPVSPTKHTNVHPHRCCFLCLTVKEWWWSGWIYLKYAYPVTAAPLMVRAQTVVALHSGLGEVQLPHISKHHRGLLIHRNMNLCCLGRRQTWIRWNVLQFHSGGEQLMKGDSSVSAGMLLGHNTSHIRLHDVFINNKLIYILSTEVKLSVNKEICEKYRCRAVCV